MPFQCQAEFTLNFIYFCRSASSCCSICTKILLFSPS